MTITKISEEVTYIEKTMTHIFDINGKKVHVYEWTKQSNDSSIMPESDTTIDEHDIEKLTDDEHEAIGEYLAECLELKIYEKFNTDN